MMNGITNRVRRLEQSMPNPDDNLELRARIERARARCEAMLSPEERAQRLTPEYIAEKAKREAEHDARMAAIRARGRKPTLAETLISGRGLLW